jgi:hypothetical protein
VPRHYGGKTVTATCDGLDTTAFRPTLIEDAAQRCDLDGQVVVLDHGSRPDRSHDLVLRDEIAMSLDEYPKHLEGARPDRDRDEHLAFILSEQPAAVETEGLEQKSLADGEHFHATVSLQPLAGLSGARESNSQTAILRRLAKFRKILSPSHCAASRCGVSSLPNAMSHRTRQFDGRIACIHIVGKI